MLYTTSKCYSTVDHYFYTCLIVRGKVLIKVEITKVQVDLGLTCSLITEAGQCVLRSWHPGVFVVCTRRERMTHYCRLFHLLTLWAQLLVTSLCCCCSVPTVTSLVPEAATVIVKVDMNLTPLDAAQTVSNIDGQHF